MTDACVLSLDDYSDVISLREPFVVAAPPAAESLDQSIQQVVEYLETESIRGPEGAKSLDTRSRMRALLTVRPPQPLPDEVHRAIDQVLLAERRTRGAVGAGGLPRLSSRPDSLKSRLALWQGDITTLAADAIVNAANPELLGCFRPFHGCIDNAIHSAAGPRLREDCARIMTTQGFPEPTGHAKATRAYNLPSRYVLHTVGPIVRGPLTAAHEQQLAQCYRACLDTAVEIGGVRSVAFCAISTGVFGFPADEAAVIAIQTVCEWLDRNPDHLDTVVFNVFTEDDHARYETLLAR